MSYIPTNTTGWTNLTNGHVISAVYQMYDVAMYGWTIAIIFFVFQFILSVKTKSLTLTFVSGIFFVAMYGLSQFVHSATVHLMFVTLVFQLSALIYTWIMKK